MCVWPDNLHSADWPILSFSLSDAKKQTILCTQGANLGPETKCNFGKTSGMWSTLRELGITGLVCVIQWSKCKQKFTGKFGNNKLQHWELAIQ